MKTLYIKWLMLHETTKYAVVQAGVLFMIMAVVWGVSA